MPNNERDLTEGKLYQISYYLYGIILTSFYFVVSNILFVITAFLAFISFQEKLFTVPFIALAIFISLIPMGPAWAATLYSIKKLLNKQFYSFTKDYFKAYKRFFKKSLGIWLFILFILLISLLNYWIVLSMDSLNFMIFPLFAIILITISMGLYIFPLLIEYSLTIKQLVQLALYFTFKKVFLTVLFLLILMGALFLLFSFPMLLLFIVPGGYALLLQFFCKKLFSKVQAEEEQV